MKKIKTIDVALYIFITTIIGYYITFSFNWGYNNYFAIPIHFIDFSISSMTKSISMIGVGLSIFIVTGIFFLDKTDVNWLFEKVIKLTATKKVNYIIQFICVCVLFLIAYLITTETNNKHYVIYVCAVMIILLIYFSLKRYKKALVLSVLMIFLMLPYILGLMNASNQTEYYIIDGYKDYLVITFTNERIIAAKFESEDNLLLSEFKVMSLDVLEETGNDLRLVKLKKPKIAAHNY